jgi:hypothetical protein
VRIRGTTGPGTSPHPVSAITASEGRLRSGYGGPPSPAVLVHGGGRVSPRGLGANPAPTTAAVPLDAPRRVTSTGGEVSA